MEAITVIPYDEVMSILEELRRDIKEIKKGKAQRPILIEHVCQITGLSKSAVYRSTSKSIPDPLPSHKKAKRLYFFEDEVIAWIKRN